MLDLFNILEKNKDFLHPNFKNSLSDVDKPIRDIIEGWSIGFIDRDGKFIDEFQRTFDSSFWELYCHAIIKEMGLEANFTYSSPDFVVCQNDNVLFNMECTISKHAKDGLPEYDSKEKLNYTIGIEESVYISTLRLSNSLKSKHDKFIQKYTKLPHVQNIPFIVAIAPFDQPNFQMPNLQSIRRVLYGLDKVKLSGDIIIHEELLKVFKDNGSEVNLGCFTDDRMKEISGVLFSCVATTGKARALSKQDFVIFDHLRYDANSTKSILGINYRCETMNLLRKKQFENLVKDYADSRRKSVSLSKCKLQKPFLQPGYTEELADGLHLMLNPFAINKINKEIINRFIDMKVTIHSYDIYTQTYKVIHDFDRSLFQRTVKIFNYKKNVL